MTKTQEALRAAEELAVECVNHLTTDVQDVARCRDLARAALAKVRAARDESGWRQIESAPLAPDQEVLVGKYHRGEWRWKAILFIAVAIEDGYTHWSTIPAAPEVK